MDLARFQDGLRDVFGTKDAKRGSAGTFMYFIEEVGELAEALREPESHDVEGEFADCLAWLTSLACLHGVDLSAAVSDKYGKHCEHMACDPDNKP